MAIISRIILKDEYSGQAKKIISSAESLNKAFGKSQSESKKLDSSLSKAFGKKHKLTIKDTDSKKVIKNVNTINGDLKKVTNKKHSVKVGVEGGNAVTRTIDGIKDKLSSLGSGSLMKSIIAGNLIAGGIQKVAGAFSSTMGAGFSRLTNIEASQARLRGFGYNQKEVKAISGSAMEAVSGTQYSMADAMTASASAIAAGLKQSELTGYLKEVGNAAAATGSDFNDVASIMNKVKTTGHLQADEMRQLSDRGLPMLSTLAEQAGVSVGEMSKRISKGQVGFDEFRNAVKAASGTASEEMAKTWDGAKENFKSALGKLGAGLLGGNETEDGEQGGLFGLMTPALLKVNDVLNSLVPKFKDAGDAIKDFVSFGVEKAKKVQELLTPVFEKIKDIVSPIIDTITDGLSDLQPILSDLAEAALPFIKEVLSVLGDVIENVLAPAFEVIVDIVNNVLKNAFETIGDIIEKVVIPALENATDFIKTVVKPALEKISDFLQDTVFPVLKKLADFLVDSVHEAFKKVVDIAGTVVSKFKDIVGAVESAVDALKGIGGKVSEAFNNAKDWVTGRDRNANGTSYYGGGRTMINERGQELIDLPKGTRIYPQGKTDEIIRSDISKQSRSNNRVVYYQPKVVINGSNMDKKELLYELEKRFKRLAVNV